MAYLLVLLVPSLAILFYYYNKDRHREPWTLIALVFLCGAFSILVAVPLEQWAQVRLGELTHRQTGVALFLECLLIPGLIEETIKLLVVVAVVFWRREFSEPVDGLVYGTAAALGFAFAEDWRFYMMEGADWRRVFSAITHPWFSSFWASSLGWAKFRLPSRGVPLVLGGLAASAIVHGVYDFLILASDADPAQAWLRHLLTPLLVVLYFLMERRLDRARAASQPEVLLPATAEGPLIPPDESGSPAD
jgi:RsiW-degrading membrane proteinase PrsW (M82 family)